MHEVKINTPDGLSAIALRAAAQNFTSGAVTAGYQANRQAIMRLEQSPRQSRIRCPRRSEMPRMQLQRRFVRTQGLRGA